MRLERKRSPMRHTSGPANTIDLDQEIESILAPGFVEKWVVEEAAGIEEARLVKSAWLHALGLNPREQLDIETHRRILSFERMIAAHDAGVGREAVAQAIERARRRGSPK